MKEQKSLLRMMQSVDAFFPIGAFTLSNGLEDYVINERITNTEELRKYLDGFLQIFPYNDLGIAASAYKYGNELDKLLYLDALTNAMKSSMEVRNGSIKMCSRFLKARDAMEDCGGTLKCYEEKIKEKKAFGFHPIAIGLYGAEIEMKLETLLLMYGYSVISAIVNNSIKLVPLSQMKGQQVLFQSMEKLEEAVQKAQEIKLEDLGVSGAAFEIHCMNHEHLYSRQYMS